MDQSMVYFEANYWILFSILGYSVLILLVFGALILALSSISDRTRTAAVFFFALLTFPDLLRQILSKIPAIGLFSIPADLRQVGALLFGLDIPYSFSPWLSLIVLLAIVGFCVWILRKRVRPVEVIK
jgi:hypothetical protein